jgi:hypothetical protein
LTEKIAKSTRYKCEWFALIATAVDVAFPF